MASKGLASYYYYWNEKGMVCPDILFEIFEGLDFDPLPMFLGWRWRYDKKPSNIHSHNVGLVIP
jgi:hypothetical protein